MNDPFQLVTNCVFKGKDYLVKMCVLSSKKLEIAVTDKLLAEEWHCEYDSSYVEMLTHRTGNYKQFDVFVAMLKCGLLKTSDSITLDLLTLEDLEFLRCKKLIHPQTTNRPHLNGQNSNRRYLILTYSVEFDRIHYPLPMDYCGPPDATVLQANIRRLESEVERLKQRSCSNVLSTNTAELQHLRERLGQLSEENALLNRELRELTKSSSKRLTTTKHNQVLQSTLKKLEEQVLVERTHFHETISKLKEEKKQLKQEIEELKSSEKWLKSKLRTTDRNAPNRISRTVPDGLSPEHPSDFRRMSRCERTEAQLTCRPISSWNSTVMSYPEQNVLRNKSNEVRRPCRSSSESSTEKFTKRRGSFTNVKTEISNRDTKITSAAALQASKHFPRRGSGDRAAQIQMETSRPLRPKVKRDDHEPSRIQNRRSRGSSLSSNGSSKRSKTSRCSKSDRDCEDKPRIKIDKTRRIANHEAIRFSMSDLETRIQALQNLLSEGLNF